MSIITTILKMLAGQNIKEIRELIGEIRHLISEAKEFIDRVENFFHQFHDSDNA